MGVKALTRPALDFAGLELLARKLPSHLEAVDNIRQTRRAKHRNTVHEMKVQMRCRRVAGIAEQAKHLTPLDVIALRHEQRVFLKMRVKRIFVMTKVEHNMVAIDILQSHGLRI